MYQRSHFKLWPWSLTAMSNNWFFIEHIKCAYILEWDRVAYELYSHLELWPQGQIIVLLSNSLSSVELFFILRWIFDLDINSFILGTPSCLNVQKCIYIQNMKVVKH
jgi:hypothetical protein